MVSPRGPFCWHLQENCPAILFDKNLLFDFLKKSPLLVSPRRVSCLSVQKASANGLSKKILPLVSPRRTSCSSLRKESPTGFCKKKSLLSLQQESLINLSKQTPPQCGLRGGAKGAGGLASPFQLAWIGRPNSVSVCHMSPCETLKQLPRRTTRPQRNATEVSLICIEQAGREDVGPHVRAKPVAMKEANPQEWPTKVLVSRPDCTTCGSITWRPMWD